MTFSVLQLKKLAKWSAWITIPAILLGILLIYPNGRHVFRFLQMIGLVIIFPMSVIHDTGLQYQLGEAIAWLLILIAQWMWFLLLIGCGEAIVTYIRTNGSDRNSRTDHE